MRLAIGQLNPLVGDTDENIVRVRSMLEEAKRAYSDVLVLPELCNSGYVFQSKEEALDSSETISDGPMCEELCKWSEKGKLVVAGICEKVDRGLYNSAVVFNDGKYLTTYRKIHLFQNEKDWFLPGEKEPPIVHFREYTFGIMICFDWAFPEVARILTLKGAQVLLHPANLVLPYCQDAMITRSIENRVFTATANRTGEERNVKFSGASQITNPKGDRLVQMSSDEIGIRTVDLDPTLANDKAITERNDVIKDRKPKLYFRLTQDD